MAGKVNTKFVVLLSVGLVAVFGLLAWGFATLAFKSGDDYERLGDAAMQEGDGDMARRMYSRAVSHDPTNRVWLDKWIDAMELWTPDTETAYQDAFYTDYMGAIRQIATTQQTDVAAHDRILAMLWQQMIMGGYSRGTADRLAEQATAAAAYFERAPGVDESWRRLLRYRGMARGMVLQQGSTLTEDEVALIGEDLRAALEADPSDDEAMSWLMRWMVGSALREDGIDAAMEASQARLDAARAGEAFLAENPGSPMTAVSVLAFGLEHRLQDETRGLSDAERLPVVIEILGSTAAQLDSLERTLANAGYERVGILMLRQFRNIEQNIDQRAANARTRALTAGFLAEDPDDAALLSLDAQTARDVGDLEGASARLEQIGELPALPLSFEGLLRFNIKRNATMTRAEVTLDLRDRVAPEEAERRESLLETAKRLREEFAGQVTEENLELVRLDGRLAQAAGDSTEALRLFQRYNEQTQNADPDGLWLEAVVASELGRSGSVRTALDNLLQIRRTDMRALLALAQVEMSLQQPARAMERYREVLRLDPSNERALEGVRSIELMNNPDRIEDPVTALLMRSQRLRRGGDGQPADPAAAAQLLEENLESVNYDPRVARELAGTRVNLGDIDGARALIAEASSRHPDDEGLQRLAGALSAEDPLQVGMALIRATGAPELEQLRAIVGLASSRGERALLDETLVRMGEIAPDDAEYIEYSFLRALQDNDAARAEALASRAEELNLDRVRGLSYRARLAVQRGDSTGAIGLLNQATALGTADSGVYRMLAMQLGAAGRTEEAIDAFDRALAIRPNDATTITEYVTTLVRANRLQAALDLARAQQRYAMGSPRFVQLWLSLEAAAGGDEGMALAVRQRERLLEINPGDRENRAALAGMYIDQKRWADAKTLIDQLRAEGDALNLVELAARWSAEQGRVGQEDGLAMAQKAFVDYANAQPDEPEQARAFLGLARFMLTRGRPDLALRAADQAVTLEDPATMDGTKFRGELLMNYDRIEQARAAFEQIVANGADNEQGGYRTRLVEMLIRQGDFAAAKEQIEQLPESARGTVSHFIQRATIAGGLGDEAAQRRILDEAVAKFPQEPLTYLNRAQSMLGRPELRGDLMADIAAALRIRPNDATALRLRAAAYFQNDQRREAIEDLRAAVKSNPNSNSMVFTLINELLGEERISEAAQIARDVTEARPSDAPLMSELGRLFEQKQAWDRASEMYGRAWSARRSPAEGSKYMDALLRRNPPDAATANIVLDELVAMSGGRIEDNPSLLAAQALVLRARGREDFALQQMTKAFEISIGDDARMATWATNASRMYEKMDPAAELNYYRSLRSRYAQPHTRAWMDYIIAQRSLTLGQGQTEALSELKRLASSPDAPDAIRGMAPRLAGSEHYRAGRFEEALDAWRVGLASSPDSWELNNNIAFVLSSKLGRHEEALAPAEKAVENDQSRFEPYHTLANIYLGLDKLSEAEQMLRTAERLVRTDSSRVSLAISRAKLALARSENGEARRQIETARATLRGIPGQDENLETEIGTLESQIDSQG